MTKKIDIKKQIKPFDNLNECTKEELIERIKCLSAHNTQLKNILAKSEDNIAKEHKNNSFNFSKYNFRHIALKIFYLGWDYQGYVTQENTTNTIEYHLFEALIRTRLIERRSSANYHRCGRTDKGVSSFGQTVSITVRSKLKDEEQDDLESEINYCKVLNRVLPDNIQCIAWAPVNDSFSARFDCKGRIYKYYFPKGNLDIEKMTIASRKLLGSHDFRNLCKMDVGNGVVEFTRNISLVSIEPINLYRSEDEYAIYVLTLKGNAFLWHQIRCILGVLLLVGQNKEEPSVIDELLDVERNSRKPEYNMASEIPLNLFSSEYDLKKWHYDEDSLSQVITKLNNIWTHTAIKQSMIGDMLTDLNKVFKDIKTNDDTVTKCFSDCLIQGVKSKKYIPVMKRQLCHSLEEKIEHFKKRNRIENIDNIQK